MGEKDRVLWMDYKNGFFSIKSLYFVLELGHVIPFLVTLIWNSRVQSKVSSFAWEASWIKMLTLDQLQKRGWSLANRYLLCKSEEESMCR